uniref:probable LRR receptor-like serine/threonine-protein kinase At4g36180 n=1 Tax=Erigeron canadensis TaxID=72917 RepID=UPI001CB8ADF4|nr:probable LRR receptor-like serine/threonine-protein kinase At4g36180 [Erigeron canadensis]
MTTQITPSFLIIFLLCTISLTYADRSEIEALTHFKNNLQDPLNALASWTDSTLSAPCDWRGIVCSKDGHVTDIRLPRLQLHGPLSDKLANLRMLRRLSLRSNSFNGSIPSSIVTKCTLLQYVFLQYNSLSGTIPDNISSLNGLVILNVAGNNISGHVPYNLPVSLRYFDVSSNSLSGELPSDNFLQEIQVLNFSYNRFTGAIPEKYGALQNLQFLWLDNNNLQGTLPSALANCTALVHFSADGNAIGGVIPSGIGSLPKLEVISLAHNNLTGMIPDSIFCSDKPANNIRNVRLGFNAFTGLVKPDRNCDSVLEVVDVQNNQIEGKFPLWLSNVSTLTDLDLSGNHFSGRIPSEIGNLKRLEELKLANNSLTGLFPSEIMQISNLKVLNLEGNLFTGEIPKFLSELKGLKMLYLGGNRFNGSIPSSFSGLVELETLSLRDNSLAGSLPEEIMSMSNLTMLDLEGNRFSGEIPVTIGNLKGLSVLNLSGNVFSGKIPGSIGSLYKLTALDLSRQNLTGELPLDLFGLPNLQVVALQENSFSGDVPEGFSSLLGLRYLNLSSNLFSGHIPSTFSYLKSLVALSLSNNNVSGKIPPEIGNCSQLQVLDLGSNGLSGRIPYDVSRLSHLTELNLSKNNLSGQIPESLSYLSNLTSLDLSSNSLDGEIPANLTAIPSLMYLNVSSNNLQGEIPEPLASRFDNESLFDGNNGLCGKPLNRKCEGESSGSRKRTIWLIVAAATGAIFMSVCCCFYTYSFFKWRKRIIERAKAGEKKRTSPQRSSGTRSSGENGGPKLVMFNNKITLAETLEATRQFDEENVLSRTRFGLIFKACYNDGMVLSIRRLQNGLLEENMFKKEAELLGKVRHRNLTVLRGYYAGPPDLRLLVYDYMPNGNLATLLQEASHQDGHVLNWPMRHLIALGIARGLAFLHSTTMVHGDIKPQNVLFDADFEAHVSEFGLTPLATIRSPEAATSTSGTVGTLGYVSPEAILTSEVTKESDVYSFGIVLLELLTGKKPVMFTQDEDIVKWVKRQLQRGQVSELLEPGLLELDPESSEWEEFLLGVKVGLLCTAPDPQDRPTMADIVFMLEGCRVGPDIPSSADPTSQPSPA